MRNDTVVPNNKTKGLVPVKVMVGREKNYVVTFLKNVLF